MSWLQYIYILKHLYCYVKIQYHVSDYHWNPVSSHSWVVSRGGWNLVSFHSWAVSRGGDRLRRGLELEFDMDSCWKLEYLKPGIEIFGAWTMLIEIDILLIWHFCVNLMGGKPSTYGAKVTWQKHDPSSRTSSHINFLWHPWTTTKFVLASKWRYVTSIIWTLWTFVC